MDRITEHTKELEILTQLLKALEDKEKENNNGKCIQRNG